MGLINLNFTFSKIAATMEPCKPLLLSGIVRNPQCYHYDEKTGEVRMVRVNKNDGGK